eukprot:1193918-Prorocentrum_minimum.AAC.5
MTGRKSQIGARTCKYDSHVSDPHVSDPQTRRPTHPHTHTPAHPHTRTPAHPQTDWRVIPHVRPHFSCCGKGRARKNKAGAVGICKPTPTLVRAQSVTQRGRQDQPGNNCSTFAPRRV